jgi:hypothetical protein
MDDDSDSARAAHFRSVARELREIGGDIRFEERRKQQLLALADGFDRFAERLERGGGSEVLGAAARS